MKRILFLVGILVFWPMAGLLAQENDDTRQNTDRILELVINPPRYEGTPLEEVMVDLRNLWTGKLGFRPNIIFDEKLADILVTLEVQRITVQGFLEALKFVTGGKFDYEDRGDWIQIFAVEVDPPELLVFNLQRQSEQIDALVDAVNHGLVFHGSKNRVTTSYHESSNLFFAKGNRSDLDLVERIVREFAGRAPMSRAGGGGGNVGVDTTGVGAGSGGVGDSVRQNLK